MLLFSRSAIRNSPGAEPRAAAHPELRRRAAAFAARELRPETPRCSQRESRGAAPSHRGRVPPAPRADPRRARRVRPSDRATAGRATRARAEPPRTGAASSSRTRRSARTSAAGTASLSTTGTRSRSHRRASRTRSARGGLHRSRRGSSAPQEREHLAGLGKPMCFALREDEPPVADDVELARLAFADRRVVALLRQLGRETRGPSVVPVSDRAIQDLDAHPAERTCSVPPERGIPV